MAAHAVALFPPAPRADRGAGVRRVVFFDVDGTLVVSEGPGANAVHKDSLTAAMVAVTGLREPPGWSEARHGGRTDRLIFRDLLAQAGIARTPALERALAEAAVAHCARESAAFAGSIRTFTSAAAARRALTATLALAIDDNSISLSNSSF
jgi:phosphoglycolate phosphatase-like HAD superfamily hydrolase